MAGDWRESLNKLADEWDDRIRGKPGESDDPTDELVVRIHLNSLLRCVGRKARTAELDRAFRDALTDRRLCLDPAFDLDV